jgi:histone-arginine methyltransferase CARM1
MQSRKRKGHELQECDLLYFEGYSLLSIHEEMLNDEPRVDAYRVAIKSLAHKKVVIDVGAGTGILSTMAMDYGARCVHAIEFSAIA